jgi:hypothetical protein
VCLARANQAAGEREELCFFFAFHSELCGCV